VWFAGYLADRFGPKLLIGLAIADYTLVSLLSPWLVSINYNVFFLARVFMGFGEVCVSNFFFVFKISFVFKIRFFILRVFFFNFQGFVMPTLAAAMARWFPPAERSLMVAICTLGNQFAALAALLLSSRLCALELLGGWPTIFYAFGRINWLLVGAIGFCNNFLSATCFWKMNFYLLTQD
jgi:MFS family permease